MPDDQFIFSSSWFPSPRFELRTLAGYNGYRGMFLPRQEAYLPLNLLKTKRNLPKKSVRTVL